MHPRKNKKVKRPRRMTLEEYTVLSAVDDLTKRWLLDSHIPSEPYISPEEIEKNINLVRNLKARGRLSKWIANDTIAKLKKLKTRTTFDYLIDLVRRLESRGFLSKRDANDTIAQVRNLPIKARELAIKTAMESLFALYRLMTRSIED